VRGASLFSLHSKNTKLDSQEKEPAPISLAGKVTVRAEKARRSFERGVDVLIGGFPPRNQDEGRN
jgi:hypothetical protein